MTEVVPMPRVVKVRRTDVYAARVRVAVDRQLGRKSEGWLTRLADTKLPPEATPVRDPIGESVKAALNVADEMSGEHVDNVLARDSLAKAAQSLLLSGVDAAMTLPQAVLQLKSQPELLESGHFDVGVYNALKRENIGDAWTIFLHGDKPHLEAAQRAQVVSYLSVLLRARALDVWRYGDGPDVQGMPQQKTWQQTAFSGDEGRSD